MADEQNVSLETKKPDISQVSSRGPINTVSMTDLANQKQEPSDEKEKDKPEKEETPPVQAPELSEEQLQAYFEKQGIKYEGLDKLKEKVNYEIPTPAAELTPEQKEAQEKAAEKRILDFYIANGGTAESYVALKNILASDLSELSAAEITGELKAQNFSEEEIQAVLKERYYQIKLDEIEQGVEENDEDFAARKAQLEKKIAYGASKLTARGTDIKTKAEGILKGLKEAIASQDIEAQEEIAFQSNVDKHLAQLPRKMTFELGKVDDQDIAPVLHEVSEESISKVASILKDPTQRKQFLFNEDGSVNYEKLANVMIRSEELDRSLRGALLEGQTRQVNIFKETFGGRGPHDIGVGNSSHQTRAKTTEVAGRGKVTRTNVNA